MDIGQAGHTAPKNHVVWWRISRSVLIAAEPSQSEQEVADGFSLANIEWNNTFRLFAQHHVDQAIIGKGFLLPVFNKLGTFHPNEVIHLRASTKDAP